MSDGDLDQLRQRIDEIDEQILRLISARAEQAQQVAEVKLSSEENPAFYRPEREAQVLKRIMALNPGPLQNEEMARLFREILSACLALEQPTRVAYLGPEGTFTQGAALKHFGHSSVTLPIATIDGVFREVEAGAAHYGVVPVENSTEGVINHTLDSFVGSNLNICGEVELRIHHNLMGAETTHRDKITRIYSHAQSMAQCRQWLDEHYPHAERVAVASNAEAARRIKSEWNSAAIASEVAAELYGLEILAEKIEDRPDNTTRFLVIGPKPVPPSGDDKTSILISVRNRPGILYDLLKPLREAGLDMTRLESRPSHVQKWHYVFFVDFIGHVDDPAVSSVFAQILEIGADLKVLGSYPRAVL